MSAPAINITSPMVPGAASGAGKGAGGAHAGFDALMEAFFASTGGVLQTSATTPAAGAPATGQGATEQVGAGQVATGQATTGPIATGLITMGEVGADVPVASAAALMTDAAKTAGAQPTAASATPGDPGGPKLPGQPAKAPRGDVSKPVGEAAPAAAAAAAAAAPTQTPLIAVATAAVDAAANVASETTTSDEAGETPPADALTSAQMATVMALMTPTPASAKPATPPPTGSSPPPPAAEALPLPAASIPPPAAPASPQASADPKLEGLGDKTPDVPTPAAAAQAAPAKTESARTPSAPVADIQTPAPTVDTPPPAAVQAAAAPPPPAAPAAEKPAKATRAAREDATPDAAAAAPAVRPGLASTVGGAEAQTGANKDPGQGSANANAPKTGETATKAVDPQLAADPTAQPPPAAASSTAHAAPAAVPRSTPETVANLAGQIVKKLGARSTQFDLQLDPAGMGKVNVRIEINADGRVSAAMSFDTPQAAAELKSRANELQRALAQSGFDVTGGLSFDVTQDQGRGSGQQNAFQNNDNSGQAFRGRAFAAALETAGDAAQSALAGTLANRRDAPTGVDVRI